MNSYHRNFIWALVFAPDYRNDIDLFAPSRRIATFKGLPPFTLALAMKIGYRMTFGEWSPDRAIYRDVEKYIKGAIEGRVEFSKTDLKLVKRNFRWANANLNGQNAMHMIGIQERLLTRADRTSRWSGALKDHNVPFWPLSVVAKTS